MGKSIITGLPNVGGFGNLVNPTIYGGISYGGGDGESGVSFTDLDSLLYSGFYTCYGTTANVPNSLTSWFIEHINSNVGTATATQFAYAYNDNEVIYKRTKTSGTWGSWEKINLPNRIRNADNSSYFEAGGNINNHIVDVGSQQSLFKQLSTAFELNRTRNYTSGGGTSDLATIKLRTYGSGAEYNDRLDIEVSSTASSGTTENYVFDGIPTSTNENKVARLKELQGVVDTIADMLGVL